MIVTPDQQAERNQQYVDSQVTLLQNKIRLVAHGLRRLAEDVERSASFKPGKELDAISDVQHAVSWGIANLNLDTLVRYIDQIQQAEKFRDDYAREHILPHDGR